MITCKNSKSYWVHAISTIYNNNKEPNVRSKFCKEGITYYYLTASCHMSINLSTLYSENYKLGGQSSTHGRFGKENP